MIKKILIGLLIILIVIQFFRPSKNDGTGIATNDISTVYPDMPQEVQLLLKQKCYDCHSHSTKYPWYAAIQPVAWWLNDHINDGKKHLNFSEFKTYGTEKATRKLEEVVEEVAAGEMPLKSYTLIHSDAVVTTEELSLLRNWVTSLGIEVGETH